MGFDQLEGQKGGFFEKSDDRNLPPCPPIDLLQNPRLYVIDASDWTNSLFLQNRSRLSEVETRVSILMSPSRDTSCPAGAVSWETRHLDHRPPINSNVHIMQSETRIIHLSVIRKLYSMACIQKRKFTVVHDIELVSAAIKTKIRRMKIKRIQ